MDIKDFIDAHWLPIATKENELLKDISAQNYQETENAGELEGIYIFEETLFNMVNTFARFRGMPEIPEKYKRLEDLLLVFNYLVILAEKDLGTHATMTVLVSRLLHTKEKARKKLN